MRKPKHYYDPRAYIPAGKRTFNEFLVLLSKEGFCVIRHEELDEKIKEQQSGL